MKYLYYHLLFFYNFFYEILVKKQILFRLLNREFANHFDCEFADKVCVDCGDFSVAVNVRKDFFGLGGGIKLCGNKSYDINVRNVDDAVAVNVAVIIIGNRSVALPFSVCVKGPAAGKSVVMDNVFRGFKGTVGQSVSDNGRRISKKTVAVYSAIQKMPRPFLRNDRKARANGYCCR